MFAHSSFQAFRQLSTSGLRRKRSVANPDASMAFIDKLRRQKGLKKGDRFQFGHFVSATDNTETKLPAFPLIGKVPEDEPPRMRFAPSPTGSLHVGGARTALYNWLVAKKGQLENPGSNAAFVLRVEDTDLARSTKESEESVLKDLTWLGLNWDEGPDMDLQYGPYRQSERGEIYLAIAQKLLDDGKAYRCFCTPEELDQMKAEQEARGETPRYDGRWRDADDDLVEKMMAEGKPFTIRFKVPDNSRVVIEDVVRGTVAWDAQATVGDFILLRSSGVPVYNFCVAVDDASMGITTVVRAEEHLTNTVRQALVLDALNAPRPRYAHCSLILGEDKQKLSKRHGATSCDQYRLDGFLPDAMINYLALLGWNDGTDNEIFTREELIDAFELRRVVKSPSVFDTEKLKWVNSQHLKMLSVEDILPLVEEQFEIEKMLKSDADSLAKVDFCYAATALAKQMMETTKDAVLNAREVLGYNLPESFEELSDPEAKQMIEMGNFYPIGKRIVEQYEGGEFPEQRPDAAISAFRDTEGNAISEDSQNGAASSGYTESYKKYMKSLSKELDVKGRNLFHPVRLALTGEMSGQDVHKQLSLLSLATSNYSVIDSEKVHVVPLADRMSRLKLFLETIPGEFRAPQSRTDKTSKKDEGIQDADPAAKSSSLGQEIAASVVDPLESYEGPPITALDIRVGRITKVWEHPEADKLYCEEIDVGEDTPRQVASGLRPYLKPEDMENRLVLVLCNLKERNMVGFPSHGMVLCASNEDHSVVRLVSPPVDAKVGERVKIPDIDFDGEDSAPFAENKIGKKKVFEKIAPFLVTNRHGIPEFLGRPFMTSAGACTSPISDGTVS